MDSTLRGSIGIAHTRWATHGEPNDVNAHPHLDHSKSIALIHNGIIENHDVLRTALEKDGIQMTSETDSEVLVQLISSLYKKSGLNFSESVRAALQEVTGAYGIVVISKDDPDTIVAARYGSPLVLGVGDGEYFIASDASPIIEHTRNVIFLEEGEMVTISPKGHEIKKIHENKVISKAVTQLDMTVEQIEKGNFPHFMLKEIHDQQHTIMDTMRGRLLVDEGTAHLGGIRDCMDRIQDASRLYITACGTSWHAGLIGKYLIEEYAQIPVHVE